MTALPSAVLTTDLHGSGRPPSPIRPRFRLLYRYWPLIAFVVESVVGWFVLRLDLWVNAVLVVCAYLIGLPLKMSIDSSSAMRVVDQLLPQVQGINSECWTTDSDLQAVASLISASKVCASPAEPTYGIGQQVWWESSSSVQRWFTARRHWLGQARGRRRSMTLACRTFTGLGGL